MEACIFCKIVRGEIPCFKVYEDARVLAFEDINPIGPGHTLVIPKAHAGNLWEIPLEDLLAVHGASKKIVEAMTRALAPTGVACVQLNGPGAHQVVMHYHLHLIPRLVDGPDLPVTSWEIRPGDMGAIEKTAEALRRALA